MSEVGTLSRSFGEQILGSRGPQRDYNHASDDQYKQLRAQAEQERGRQQEFAAKAKKAYDQGNKEQAHEFSEQARQYEAKADDLSAQAAGWVFRANNADSGPDEIDLHGLFVKESLSALDARIHAAQSRGERELKIITGKGIHSQNHVAKLRPAVEEYLTKAGIPWHVQTGNAGVVVANVASNAAPYNPQLNQQNQQQAGYYGGQGQHQNFQQGGYGQGNQANYGQQQGYHSGGYNQGGYNQGQYSQGNQNQGGQNNLDPQKIMYYFRTIKRIMRVFRGCL